MPPLFMITTSILSFVYCLPKYYITHFFEICFKAETFCRTYSASCVLHTEGERLMKLYQIFKSIILCYWYPKGLRNIYKIILFIHSCLFQKVNLL